MYGMLCCLSVIPLKQLIIYVHNYIFPASLAQFCENGKFYNFDFIRLIQTPVAIYKFVQQHTY